MVQLCGARGADPLTNEHRVRTTECPHLPHAFGSHLIVLCSLKQRTQFNSRLISVTASPQLHLPAPPPLPLVPHLSQLCPSCLTCLTTPSCLTCAEFPLHYFAGLSKDAQWIPARGKCLYSLIYPRQPPTLLLLLCLFLTLLAGRKDYLVLFTYLWHKLVEFISCFVPHSLVPPWSGTTHT